MGYQPTTTNTLVEIDLVTPESIPANYQPEILYTVHHGRVSSKHRFTLPPEETLVLKWDLHSFSQELVSTEFKNFQIDDI